MCGMKKGKKNYKDGGMIKATDKMLKKGNTKSAMAYCKLPGKEVMGQSPEQVSGRKWDGTF